MRGKQGAAGAKGGANQAIGISHGGRSTKFHALIDAKGRPLQFVVTGGQVHDNQVVGQLLKSTCRAQYPDPADHTAS